MRFGGLGLKCSMEPAGVQARAVEPVARDIFTRGADLEAVITRGDRLTNPFAQQADVFSCIRAIMTTFIQAPFTLYQGEKEVTSGPLWEKFQTPCPWMSGTEMWQYTLMFLEMTGNAIWWLDNNGQRNSIPRNILVFNSRFFSPVRNKDSGIVMGYEFNPGGTRHRLFLSLDEVLHFRYLNPDDPFWGIGPLGVARGPAEMDYRAELYNAAFFENNAEPTGMMIYKGEDPLTEEQKKEIMLTWAENHQGVLRAFKMGFLPGKEWDYKQLGLTQRDMDYLQLRKFNQRQIAKIFNVPPLLMGDFEKSGLSDAGLRIQMRMFWDTNLLPKSTMLSQKVTSEFLSRFQRGLTGEFDQDKVKALKLDFSELVVQAQMLNQMGWPINQINAKLDMGFDDVPWGDDVYVQSTLVPLSQLAAGTLPEPAPAPAPAGGKQAPAEPAPAKGKEAKGEQAQQGSGKRKVWPDDEQERALAEQSEAWRVRIWRAIASAPVAIEAEYRLKIRKFWFRLRGNVLGVIERAATARAVQSNKLADVYVVLEHAKSDLTTLSGPFFFRGYRLGGAHLYEEIGQDGVLFTASTPYAEAFLAEKAIRITGIVDTVKEQIRGELLVSLEESESLGQIADRVRSVFNMATNRSHMIARTEIGQAVSGGRYEALDALGITSSSWLSARDTNVRHTHAPGTGVDGEIRQTGKPFSNGCLFPLDPDGPAGEVINCRCTLLPVL